MKRRFRSTLCLLIIGCIILGASGCPIRIKSAETTEYPETSGTEDPAEQISRIDVYHSSFGMTEGEYRIDLDGRSFLIFRHFSDYEDFAPRDPDAENEGFTLVCELSDEAVETFRGQCEHSKLTRWKEQYYNNDICDGHQWSMVITFADGTIKEIFGSNEYPDSWDKMRIAFRELTGIDVLAVSSDWLDG